MCTNGPFALGVPIGVTTQTHMALAEHPDQARLEIDDIRSNNCIAGAESTATQFKAATAINKFKNANGAEIIQCEIRRQGGIKPNRSRASACEGDGAAVLGNVPISVRHFPLHPYHGGLTKRAARISGELQANTSQFTLSIDVAYAEVLDLNDDILACLPNCYACQAQHSEHRRGDTDRH